MQHPRAWASAPPGAALAAGAVARAHWLRARLPTAAPPLLSPQALLVDLAAPGRDLPPAGPAAPAPDGFTSLAWGTAGADGPHPVRGEVGDGVVGMRMARERAFGARWRGR